MESPYRPNRLTLARRRTVRSMRPAAEAPSLCCAEHIPLSFRVRCALWNSTLADQSVAPRTD